MVYNGGQLAPAMLGSGEYLATVATPPPPSGKALAFAAFAVCEVCPHYGPAAAPSANSPVDLGVQIDLVCLGFESVGGTIPISSRKASPPDQS